MPEIALQKKKKYHKAWAMYDWANSAYNLVITSTIFPAYYEAMTSVKKDGVIIDDQVNFFGWQLSNTSLFNYAVAFSYLIIALLSPILSSIADVKNNKRAFLRFFTYLGATACALLYFFSADRLEMGLIFFILAAIGFCGGTVFYNAYLPEIANPDEQNLLSAKGFTYGYIGSMTLQIICFIFVMKPEWFGQDQAWGSRFSFFLVGLWWFSFAHIPLTILPKSVRKNSPKIGFSIIQNAFNELNKVWQNIKKYTLLKTYLFSFFFYSMGVQTVILAATLFGSKELKLETGQLIITIMLIQFIGIAGAYLIARLATKVGNFIVLMGVISLWIVVCISAYFVTTAMQFYGVAALVGIVMGGVQALSRATYSKLIPKDTPDTTSYFSFYDVTEKVAVVIGMFSFGFIEQMTGSMRNSIFALIVFFVIGLIGLFLSEKIKQKSNYSYF